MTSRDPYVCVANAGYEVVHIAQDETKLHFTPIIAWESIGKHVVPLTLFPVANIIAVVFPDGQVVDLDDQSTWADVDSWREKWHEIERNFHRSVKGVEVKPETKPHVEISVSKPLRELGLSGRAVAPLERRDIKCVADLTHHTRAEVLAVRGVPASAGKTFDRALAQEGHTWKIDPTRQTPSAPEPDDLTEDDPEALI